MLACSIHIAFLPTEDNKTVEAAEGNPHQPQIMNNSCMSLKIAFLAEKLAC